MDLERLVDELWCGNHGLGDVSQFLLRALRNDESAAKAEFSKFLQGKLSDGLLKLSRRAVEKVWPSASPRTFAWSARAYHERQQTISHRRYFVACRGRDWPLKTASTFAVRAREARPSGGETRILVDPIHPEGGM